MHDIVVGQSCSKICELQQGKLLTQFAISTYDLIARLFVKVNLLLVCPSLTGLTHWSEGDDHFGLEVPLMKHKSLCQHYLAFIASSTSNMGYDG